jgi:hypothetical protein
VSRPLSLVVRPRLTGERERGLALRVIAELLKRTVAALNQGSVSEASLAAVAEGLRHLAAELALPPADFPPTGLSQELVYELAEDARCGIAEGRTGCLLATNPGRLTSLG